MSSTRDESTSKAAVADLVQPLHDRWFRLVHERLAPLLVPEATLPDRWPAVRFLSDQFDDWLGHERRLLQSLARCLPPADGRRVRQSTEALASICRELDHVGRHRMAGDTAEVARRFFARLELWRTEVEAALAKVGSDQLGEGDRRQLAHLDSLAG